MRADEEEDLSSDDDTAEGEEEEGLVFSRSFASDAQRHGTSYARSDYSCIMRMYYKQKSLDVAATVLPEVELKNRKFFCRHRLTI